MKTILSFIVLLFSVGDLAALICLVDVRWFAQGCPTIVRGSVVRIDNVKDNRGRNATAVHLKVEKIHKQFLNDEPLEVGTTMVVYSTVPARYQVGQQGVWLLLVDENGSLQLGKRPEQFQPLGEEADLKKRGVFDDPRYWTHKKGQEKATRQTWTKAEWGDYRKKQEEGLETAERNPDYLAAKTLGRELAKAKTLTKEHLDRYVRETTDVRRRLLSFSPKELGFSDANRFAFVKLVMQHEGNRSYAYGWLDASLGGEETQFLLSKLREAPPKSRIYYLQMLWRAKEKAMVADVVAEYLRDSDGEVRNAAVRTIGFLGERKHVPAILETHRREKTTKHDCSFAESLSQLGEVDLTLHCVRTSMNSQNWNIRWGAAEALRRVQSARVVPLAMELLETEFAQMMEESLTQSIGDRVFIALCQTLEKNTKQKHGADVLAWQRWWNEHCKEYAGQPVRISAEAVTRTQEAYWKLFPFRKTRID